MERHRHVVEVKASHGHPCHTGEVLVGCAGGLHVQQVAPRRHAEDDPVLRRHHDVTAIASGRPPEHAAADAREPGRGEPERVAADLLTWADRHAFGFGRARRAWVVRPRVAGDSLPAALLGRLFGAR